MFSLRPANGATTSLSLTDWRLLLFVAHCRLPHRRLLASGFIAAALAAGACIHPAPGASGRLCSLTVQSQSFPTRLAPVLERVTVRAGDQLVATTTRVGGTDQHPPARFRLACGVYDVSVDGDAGGGVGTQVTTTVRLDQDQTISLDLQ